MKSKIYVTNIIIIINETGEQLKLLQHLSRDEQSTDFDQP